MEERTLERLRFYLQTVLDEKLAEEFAGSRTVKISAMTDFFVDKLVLQIKQEILGTTLEEVSVIYPTTWWDAFKKKYFPWTKINYTTVKLVARELYPKLSLPDLDPLISLTKERK